MELRLGILLSVRAHIILEPILIVGISAIVGKLRGNIAAPLIVGLILGATVAATWVYMWILKREALEERGFRW